MIILILVSAAMLAILIFHFVKKKKGEGLFKKNLWRNIFIYSFLCVISLIFLYDDFAATAPKVEIKEKNITKQNISKAILQDYFNQAISLLNAGKDMDDYRQNPSHEDLVTCGNLMRKYLPEAKQLREKTAKLPLKYISLRIGISQLSLCTTCKPSAMEYCVLAQKDLHQAKKDLILTD